MHRHKNNNNYKKHKAMIITTTNNIEGAEITQYIRLVSTNVVIGTNFFSDFAASFTDFFGGRSTTYQHKLDDVYQNAMYEIEQKAASIGADAVVGLKMDFNEISGKGKTMFMVSAVGTAVKIRRK